MSKAPSERELLRVERELKQASPGDQRAVGGGIYMRLDRSATRRFVLRARRVDGRPGGTYDSWQEAYAASASRESCTESAIENGEPTAAGMRHWSIPYYASKAWWPNVLMHCDKTTVRDYRRGLKDLVEHVAEVTLAQLESSPLLIDGLKQKLVEAKTFPPGHKRAGQLPKAAADKALKTLSIICGDAAKRGVLVRNPMAGVQRFNVQRSAAGSADAPSHRPILQSEVKHPRTIVRAASGMRGDPLTLERRRLIPELIGIGMRPSDILATRNGWWRDEQGAKRLLHIDSAVKDLGTHQIEGEPKTGARDLYLFDAIAERLLRIDELAGSPGLDALTFPNAKGGLLNWGNWRTEVWYPALHRAGISKGPTPDVPDAFWPYVLRHVGVTTMLHAERPEGGTYSEREVARQFGHTVPTLDRVYADIPKDMHNIAGLTMDEIIRAARREIWGPMPGDADYEEIEYDLIEAAELTGIRRNALAARVHRGSIPGVKRNGKCYVTRFDLAWHGLVPRGR